MIFTKSRLITLIISIFLSLIIFYLLKHQIIYPTISPMVKNGVASIFADWSVILSANLCQDRFDVYLENPCDLWNRGHVYGGILLKFPYVKNFIKFYYLYIPVIFNFLFIYLIVSFFNFKKKIEYLSLFPFIFSIPVLLAVERANIDILIFLFIYLISINKNLIINYFAIILTTVSKFYPVILMIIFLFKKNVKQIFFHSLILILLISLLMFLEIEDLKKIFVNRKQIFASGHSAFSFVVSIEYFNSFKIKLNNSDYTFVKYLFLFFVFIIPIFVTTINSKKNIFSNQKIKNLILINNYENRLYILSSTVVIICFFVFKNHIYREIFFLGLIPWILKERNNSEKNNFISFYYYLLCFKFLFTTLAIYINRNDIIPLIKPFVTIGKHCLDFYVVFIVLLIFMTALISLFNELIKNQLLKTNL